MRNRPVVVEMYRSRSMFKVVFLLQMFFFVENGFAQNLNGNANKLNTSSQLKLLDDTKIDIPITCDVRLSDCGFGTPWYFKDLIKKLDQSRFITPEGCDVRISDCGLGTPWFLKRFEKSDKSNFINSDGCDIRISDCGLGTPLYIRLQREIDRSRFVTPGGCDIRVSDCGLKTKTEEILAKQKKAWEKLELKQTKELLELRKKEKGNCDANDNFCKTGRNMAIEAAQRDVDRLEKEKKEREERDKK